MFDPKTLKAGIVWFTENYEKKVLKLKQGFTEQEGKDFVKQLVEIEAKEWAANAFIDRGILWPIGNNPEVLWIEWESNNGFWLDMVKPRMGDYGL